MIYAKDVFYKAPEERVSEVQRIMDLYADDFGIFTDTQLAVLYAQVLAEVSPDMRHVIENMNYSEDRLKVVFKKFRNNPELASKYGRNNSHRANQVQIANHAYGNRLGNGDPETGDGWRYRGRGLIQITGRETYRDVSKVIKDTIDVDFMLETFPDTVASDTGAVITLLGYWKMKKLHKIDNIDKATEIINKYTDSYKKRRYYFNKVKKLIKD